jgi:hypothetical protein
VPSEFIVRQSSIHPVYFVFIKKVHMELSLRSQCFIILQKQHTEREGLLLRLRYKILWRGVLAEYIYTLNISCICMLVY